MEEYIEWLENKIEVCLEDKDLQREHWAFCQALKKYRELALRQSCVIGSVCPCGRCLDEVDIQFKQCYECGRYWGQTDL